MIEYSKVDLEKLPSTASKESEEVSKDFKESVLWWT